MPQAVRPAVFAADKDSRASTNSVLDACAGICTVMRIVLTLLHKAITAAVTVYSVAIIWTNQPAVFAVRQVTVVPIRAVHSTWACFVRGAAVEGIIDALQQECFAATIAMQSVTVIVFGLYIITIVAEPALRAVILVATL